MPSSVTKPEQRTRFLEMNKCPKCGAVLYGEFDGLSQMVECDFGGPVTYDMFRFPCPKCKRSLTMMESGYIGTRVFWLSSDEKILDRYQEYARTKSKRLLNGCLYLYTPLMHDLDSLFEKVRNAIMDLQSDEYKISVVSWQGLESAGGLPEDIVQRVFRKWVLPDSFFSLCRGNKYPSLIAEMNIVSEMRQWTRHKLVSFYPTALPDFEIRECDGMDWAEVERVTAL